MYMYQPLFCRDQRLRELVIDLVPPRFKQLTHSLSQSLSSNLNSSQHDALLKVRLS